MAPHRLGGPSLGPCPPNIDIDDLKVFLTCGLWGDTLKPQPRWEVPTFAGYKVEFMPLPPLTWAHTSWAVCRSLFIVGFWINANLGDWRDMKS